LRVLTCILQARKLPLERVLALEMDPFVQLFPLAGDVHRNPWCDLPPRAEIV